MSASQPKPRNFRTPREAEEIACEWMKYFGWLDARLTNKGADGGVDITSREAAAQVKTEMKPIGRPAIQCLLGIAKHENKDAIFFSLSGYSTAAIEWAANTGVALFQFNYAGEVEPSNTYALNLINKAKYNSTGIVCNDKKYPAKLQNEIDFLRRMGTWE